MASFPAYMRFQSATFSETMISNVTRTVMEDGSTKQRRRNSLRRTERNVTYLLNTADLQSFKTWIENDIAGGALFFDWIDPVDNQPKQARVVGGEINISPVTVVMNHYLVTFGLETFDAP